MTLSKGPGRPKSRFALYLAWAAVFVAAFVVGGYTLAFVIDAESVGTANDPNVLGAADDFGNIGNVGNIGNIGNIGNAVLFDPVRSLGPWFDSVPRLLTGRAGLPFV